MRKKRSAPHAGQLELRFEREVKRPEQADSTVSNVVTVAFGTQKRASLIDNRKERALIERILQNAQKLKW